MWNSNGKGEKTKGRKKKAGDSKRRRLDTPGMVTHRQHSRLFSSTPCFDPFQSIEQKTIGAVPLPQDSCCGGKKSSPQLAIFGSRPPNYYIFFLMKFLSTKSNEACKRVAKETENIKLHFNFLFYTHQLEEELQTSRRSGWSR